MDQTMEVGVMDVWLYGDLFRSQMTAESGNKTGASSMTRPI